MTATLAVLGAGSWGTALAMVLARNGLRVRLWGHHREHVAELARTGENARYLPGAAFPAGLTPEPDLAAAISGVRDVLVVVPSHGFRPLLEQLQPLLGREQRLAWATKGLDAASGSLLHEVAAELLPTIAATAVLSGPSFAKEVAHELPSAVTVASADSDYAQGLADYFHNESFRVYTSSDVIGVELGGAVKNVLAIAAGVSDGLGFGANARAALITRGLSEMSRLGAALGARTETLMGLTGLGDLILTCTDDQSRNRRMGLALGRGESLQHAEAAIGQTVEGVRTAREIQRLAARMHVEMPICHQVYRLIEGEVDAASAVRELMLRERKSELE